MTVIKQQISLFFRPEYLPSKWYIKLFLALDLTTEWSDSNNTQLLLKVGNKNITWI